MRIMEQIESFESLSIACRKHSQASVASSCSCSDLTWMPDNDAEEPTPGSPPSSSESSPLMTPDTSDDEDEDLLPLPEPVYRNSSASGEDLLDTLVAAPDQSRDGDEDLMPSSEAAHSPFDDEHEDPLATLAMAPESSEDEDEIFHHAPGVPGPYYGSRLCSIRVADKATLEEISREIPSELTRAQMRVLRELKSIHEDDTTPYLSVVPIDGNLGNCLASMEGSPGTPYEDGVFWLHFEYPETYPLRPPVITFLTPVYHPNIVNGRICLDILENSWTPCLQTQTLLLSILSVLHHPILYDSLVPQIAQKYEEDYSDFCAMARLYTEESAHGLRPDTSDLLNLTSGDSS